MKHRSFTVVAVHLVLVREGQVLLLRRHNTGYEDGNFSLPAGHVEAGERALVAMVREAKEEACIDVTESMLAMAHVMHRMGNDHERVDFFFVAREWSGEPKIGEPDYCSELKWHPLSSLPADVIPYIRSALESIARNQVYSEFEW